MRSSAGKPAGGVKRVMHAADREREAARRCPARAQCRRAGEREAMQQPRVDEQRIDRHRALIEIEEADRIQIQAQQIVVRARQDRRSCDRARRSDAARRARGSAPRSTVISVTGTPHCSCTIKPNR